MLLSDLDPNKTYSYADYYRWTFDNRVELINGKIYELVPGPNRAHQDIVVGLLRELSNFLRNKQCKVYVAPFDVRLPRKGIDDKSIFTVLQPDICVICDVTKLDARGCIGAPDIVVEVLSPGNNSKELKKKFVLYEEAGVKEYWIVSPQNQTVIIYTLQENKFHPSNIMSPGDYVTSSVLAGFTLDLTELFKHIGIDD